MILGAISATPVYALMAFSVVLTLMGHIFRDQKIVGIGLALLFLATALLLLGAYQSYQDSGPPRRPEADRCGAITVVWLQRFWTGAGGSGCWRSAA